MIVCGAVMMESAKLNCSYFNNKIPSTNCRHVSWRCSSFEVDSSLYIADSLLGYSNINVCNNNRYQGRSGGSRGVKKCAFESYPGSFCYLSTLSFAVPSCSVAYGHWWISLQNIAFIEGSAVGNATLCLCMFLKF